MPNTHFLVSKIILVVSGLLLLLNGCGPSPTLEATSTMLPTDSPTLLSPTIDVPTQTPFVITTTHETTVVRSEPTGIFFLSLQEGGNSHLFAYAPQTLSLTRLTTDIWDDITPSLDPNGSLLAYSSRRNGYWDLYLLDLIGGGITQLTDTPQYDGAPTWSPDGAFIAYESYVEGNLDIFIRSVTDPQQVPLQLTQNPSTDTSPAWSPHGREIAFISNRSGDPEVWIADLDHAGIFSNVSNNPQTIEAHPAWSPDGSKLAWASTDPDSGLTSIYIWDSSNPTLPARWAGSGDWPIWMDNSSIACRLPSPNQFYLSGFTLSGSIIIPPLLLPGAMNGLSYGITSLEFPGPFLAAAQVTHTAPFVSARDINPNMPMGRASLVLLPDITATFPQLNEQALESFQALRLQISSQTGWDPLSNLENAFVPLTIPLDPGLGEDWLYTGRAFTLNPVLVQANWLVVVREDFGQQIFWRVYLHASAQDGSQGMPLSQVPWDFSSRSTSSFTYENGGQLMNSIPSGYWIDLTTVANQYGWERLPALTNWRTYYSGARFNEFAYAQGLDWRNAMLQLYPPEVLVTPTIVIPPTRTPTRTPLWFRSPTPTRTPTLHPTYSPIP
jgi:TolB protein